MARLRFCGLLLAHLCPYGSIYMVAQNLFTSGNACRRGRINHLNAMPGPVHNETRLLLVLSALSVGVPKLTNRAHRCNTWNDLDCAMALKLFGGTPCHFDPRVIMNLRQQVGADLCRRAHALRPLGCGLELRKMPF